MYLQLIHRVEPCPYNDNANQIRVVCTLQAGKHLNTMSGGAAELLNAEHLERLKQIFDFYVSGSVKVPLKWYIMAVSS